MPDLYIQYTNALQSIRGPTSNHYLNFLKSSVEMVSNASNIDQVLTDHNETLKDIVSCNNFELDSQKTNDFIQILGETHFYLLCKNKGINLTRIKEEKFKTPDFKLDSNDIHFEVKTLSVVSGSFGIDKALKDSLDTELEIERQQSQGKSFSIGVTEIAPYGNKPSQNDKGTISAIIDTLLEKARQNIKQGQFPNDKSFLVLNLSIIPPFRTQNYILKPTYCDDFMFNKAVSGELWMMAFSQIGAPVLGIPEFEGMSCVESIMSKLGILSDPNFDMVAGILFMIHPWGKSTEICGLYNHKNVDLWNTNGLNIFETLMAITGKNWNDEIDTNGWQLHG